MFRSTPGTGTTLLELLDEQGRMLSRIDLIDLHLWFGGCIVDVGGIASVFTPEEHRRKGYARQCMDEAIARQTRAGLPFSFLFGIRDFYEPMGYVPVMPWYDVRLDARMLGNLPADQAWGDLTPEQRTQWDRWHNEASLIGCGAAARGPAYANSPRFPTVWRSSAITRALSAPDGSLRAVVVYGPPNPKGFEVAEVVAADDAGYRAALVHLLHETARRGRDSATLVLPPDDPFSTYLRQFDVPFTITTRQSGGGMARLLDIGAWSRAFAPVLRRRADALAPNLCPTSLAVITPVGRADCVLGGSAPLASIELSDSALTQVSFGYLPFERLQAVAARIEGLDHRAGAALFPSVHPFMHLIDRF